VSIQELKRHLSRILSEAEGGAQVVVTRHRRPVVHIASARPPHVQVGARATRSRLEPLLAAPTRGRYLDVLADDRRGAAS
jgi:prevent-host-death family protein